MKNFPAPVNPYKKEEKIVETVSKPALLLECIYAPSHNATLLHRGTAYCRSCYDDKNRTGNLIN